MALQVPDQHALHFVLQTGCLPASVAYVIPCTSLQASAWQMHLQALAHCRLRNPDLCENLQLVPCRPQVPCQYAHHTVQPALLSSLPLQTLASW